MIEQGYVSRVCKAAAEQTACDKLPLHKGEFPATSRPLEHESPDNNYPIIVPFTHKVDPAAPIIWIHAK